MKIFTRYAFLTLLLSAFFTVASFARADNTVPETEQPPTVTCRMFNKLEMLQRLNVMSFVLTTIIDSNAERLTKAYKSCLYSGENINNWLTKINSICEKHPSIPLDDAMYASSISYFAQCNMYLVRSSQ